MDFLTPPLYAVDGRHVDIPELEAEYLSADSVDLQLIWLFQEAEKLREIARLAAEVRLAQRASFVDLASARRSKTLEWKLDRLLTELTFREPAQTSLFEGK